MKIAEACRETGISKSTIHFYISEKLISPKTDPENGYYIFEEEDISRLIFCRNFRNVGVPIPEIRSLLRNPLTAGHYLNLHIQKLMTLLCAPPPLWPNVKMLSVSPGSFEELKR